MEIQTQSVAELLALYSEVIEELQRRGVTRSSNNPVADYAEYLCVKALALRVADKSTKGFDAMDRDDCRYQVKGRRLTHLNDSRQLGALRDLEAKPFDFLIGVLFTENFRVYKACQLPIAKIPRGQYIARTNSWRIVLHDNLWSLPGAIDLTDKLRKAQAKHGF